MPLWLEAGLWGLAAGSAFFIGTLIGLYASLPQRLIAGVMAFGAGVLISALTFDLIADAFLRAGLIPTLGGALLGALIYTLANLALAQRGARHRKRSRPPRGTEMKKDDGLAIALGGILDGIPEGIAIGLSLLTGGAVSFVMIGAVSLSNFPEGVSAASGMKLYGRSTPFILVLAGAIMLISAIAAWAGYVIFSGLPGTLMAWVTALAAGGILAMLADTMMPEAYADAHDWTGLITVIGFLCAFVLDRLGEG